MIEKVRDMVDKALTWLVNKAVDTAFGLFDKLMVLGGKIVKALSPWNKADTDFQADDGESHKLYFEMKGSTPVLLVASNPTSILDFLSYWEKRPGIKPDKLSKIADARTHYNSKIVPLVKQVQDSEAKGEPEANRIGLLNELLKQNSKLSMFIKVIIGSSANLASVKQRYALEGMTGRYNSMAGGLGDQFEADHQPQNSALEYAAKKNCFSMVSNLRTRAANRADLGWTINLHQVRHRKGRTYGKSPPAKFTDDVDKADNSTTKNERTKRSEIVGLLIGELNADVSAMNTIATQPLTHVVWSDLRDPSLGLTKKDQDDTRDTISQKILAGESQMKNQPMSNMIDL